MMVHYTGGKRGGNIELDRTVKGIRIRRSIESKDPKKLRRLNVALDKLAEDDRLDTIRAFATGELSPSELIEADRHGTLARSLNTVRTRAFLWDRLVPTAQGDRTEVGVISRTMARVPGTRTRGRYLASFIALQRKAADVLPADAKVIDLLTIDWGALYGRWGATNADWMHLRRALSRFATLYMGDKWDPFARQLRQVIPAKKVKKRRPKLTIDQFKAIVAAAPPHAAAAFWVLVITGVRVGEYLASKKTHLHKAAHLYVVPGAEKNDIGEFPLRVDPRLWIFLERGIPARLGYKWLRIYWIRACQAVGVADVTLHDLRHCHGQWAINANVAESKVQGSLRHENPAQTRDYVMQAGTLDVSTALADVLLGAAPRTKGRRA